MWLKFHWNRRTGGNQGVIPPISVDCGFLHGYLQLNYDLALMELAGLVCMEMQKMRSQKQQHLGRITLAKRGVSCFPVLQQDTLCVCTANRSTAPSWGERKAVPLGQPVSVVNTFFAWPSSKTMCHPALTNTRQAVKEYIANWEKNLSQSSKAAMRGPKAEGKGGQWLATVSWEIHTWCGGSEDCGKKSCCKTDFFALKEERTRSICHLEAYSLQ